MKRAFAKLKGYKAQKVPSQEFFTCERKEKELLMQINHITRFFGFFKE
ncbi:MAG: hypothetical protein ACFFCZ_03845 [Promethearchaeota archaeon]